MVKTLDPEISVVVTVVDGAAALDRCLDSLDAQEDSPRLEVIVPYDDTMREIGLIQSRYPFFTFLDLGRLIDHAPRNEFEKHDLYDRRRAGGLKVAKAPLIAMIEERGAAELDDVEGIMQTGGIFKHEGRTWFSLSELVQKCKIMDLGGRVTRNGITQRLRALGAIDKQFSIRTYNDRNVTRRYWGVRVE